MIQVSLMNIDRGIIIFQKLIANRVPNLSFSITADVKEQKFCKKRTLKYLSQL